MRRFGDKIRGDIKYTNRPGAYGVLVRDGRVLLTHQSHPAPEFQLPGGGIDPGETPLRALHREVREETGWRIGVVARLGVYQRYTYMAEYDMWARKICHIYLARPSRQIGEPTEPHHQNHWMDIDTAIEVIKNTGDLRFLTLALSDSGGIKF